PARRAGVRPPGPPLAPAGRTGDPSSGPAAGRVAAGRCPMSSGTECYTSLSRSPAQRLFAEVALRRIGACDCIEAPRAGRMAWRRTPCRSGTFGLEPFVAEASRLDGGGCGRCCRCRSHLRHTSLRLVDERYPFFAEETAHRCDVLRNVALPRAG